MHLHYISVVLANQFYTVVSCLSPCMPLHLRSPCLCLCLCVKFPCSDSKRKRNANASKEPQLNVLIPYIIVYHHNDETSHIQEYTSIFWPMCGRGLYRATYLPSIASIISIGLTQMTTTQLAVSAQSLVIVIHYFTSTLMEDVNAAPALPLMVHFPTVTGRY